VKHSDFLKSLKALKSHLSKKKPSQSYIYNNIEDKDICMCKDSNGEVKYLYSSQDELKYMLALKSTQLKAYHCPYEKGWHITKG